MPIAYSLYAICGYADTPALCLHCLHDRFLYALQAHGIKNSSNSTTAYGAMDCGLQGIDNLP